MDLIRRPVHPRIQRRRALAASLHIPPELGAKFTEGEMAVLKVIADRHVRHSACTLTRDAIADLSGRRRRPVDLLRGVSVSCQLVTSGKRSAIGGWHGDKCYETFLLD